MYDFFLILPNKLAKKMAFLTQNKAKSCKNLNITLIVEKNAIFEDNCQKSQITPARFTCSISSKLLTRDGKAS
jgi:hypothetical protein